MYTVLLYLVSLDELLFLGTIEIFFGGKDVSAP